MPIDSAEMININEHCLVYKYTYIWQRGGKGKSHLDQSADSSQWNARNRNRHLKMVQSSKRMPFVIEIGVAKFIIEISIRI